MDNFVRLLLECALVLGCILSLGSTQWYAEAHEDDLQRAGTARVARDNSSNASTGTSNKLVRYRLDASQSLITARVFVGGILAAFGHDHTVSVSGFRGEVQMTPTTIEPASVQMVFDARSAAEVGKEFAEKERTKINHSIQEEGLETSKFPAIAFKSTKISITKASESRCRAKIIGDLTLHGMTQSIEVPADVILREGGLTAEGEFQIRHRDFGIRQLSAVAGALKAKDGIAITYKLVATAE